MKTAATSAGDAASRSRRIRARETPARKPDAARAVRAPLRDAADHAIIPSTFRNTGVAPRPNMNTNQHTICPAGRRSTFSCVGATLVSAGHFFKHEVAPMKTKTNTSRKAQTAAAKSATNTTTDATTSRWELEHPTGVNDDQRKKRAARFKEYAEQYVAALRDDERAVLDEAARNVGTTAAAFISSKLIEERGLGSRRDEEAMFHRWSDDLYENGTSRSRNDHEKQETQGAIALFCKFDPAGLTTDEKVEVVRRYFRKGDRHLDVATGRAIKDALALAPKTNEKDAEPITWADSGEDLTIRISGTAYANLATMAKTMNGVAWCDKDNTPATVASTFVFGDTFENLAKPTRMSCKFIVGGCGEIAADICDCIDTGCDCETDEHERRCKELRTALLAALPTAGDTSGANT